MSLNNDENLEDVRRERDQLIAVVRTINRRHMGNLPLPDEALRLHVGTRTTEANFLAQGAASSERVLKYFGTDPEFPVLDWGCGSGRTWRWLQMYPGWRRAYHGIDVDSEAIQWLRSIGAPNCEVCSDDPPLPYADGRFGGVFAFSVLTHIPPPHHKRWYEELRRVLRPGGRAFLTTQGSRVVADGRVAQRDSADYHRDGWVHVRHEGHYKDAALVSEEFTRAALDGVLTLIEYKTSGYQNMDLILAERPV
jgi:SAM-dependent methyltransferase